MHRAETVILKLNAPTLRKRIWLNETDELFRQGCQLGLDFALGMKTSSRAKIHNAAYAAIKVLGLPSDYCRMAVNQAVQLARSHHGIRASKRKAGKPVLLKSQGIGLGTHAYTVKDGVLRVSTGKRGTYIWLPLCVPARWREKLQYIKGDARLFQRQGEWYVMFPLRIPHTPAVSNGDPTVLGVDLGVVRIATLATPKGIKVWSGKQIRTRREHFSDLRGRYQAHRRNDRVKASKGRERRWMQDVNHKLSKELVDIAAGYPNPVLAFEQLDGIRDRVRGSKRFNRMMSSWTFRDLLDKVTYKAANAGVGLVLVDPRRTSRTCPRCGHATRSNRPTQADFRCVSCGYRGNADAVASINIAAAAVNLLQQGALDTPRPGNMGRTASVAKRPDGAKV
ncbi:MAG: transposase [Syntrophorhabdaceae bacterium]|nr:transposase [Syntrophorhabdaceae bacterium]